MVNYYCISVSASAYNRRRDVIIVDLKKILGDRKAEFIIIDDADLLATGEFYVFINSSKFADKVPQVSALQSVTNIHSAGGKPFKFPENEVKKFQKNVKKGSSDNTIGIGDTVVVRRGYLKNLHGIVKHIIGNKCRVFFTIHTRTFTETINKSWVNKTGDIFGSRPPCFSKELWLEKFTKGKR
jgi:hypothetical protein